MTNYSAYYGQNTQKAQVTSPSHQQEFHVVRGATYHRSIYQGRDRPDKNVVRHKQMIYVHDAYGGNIHKIENHKLELCEFFRRSLAPRHAQHVESNSLRQWSALT